MLVAERLDMCVELFICDYNVQLVGGNLFNADGLKRAKNEHLEKQQAFLTELARPWAERGLRITVKAAWDRPLYEGIVRQALRGNARYVFKETRYHSALARALFTNTDWHLIRSCPAPLWLVHPDRGFNQPKVLAAVDPLHENDKPAELDVRLLSEALEIADVFGGAVHVAHAFNPYLEPGDPERVEQRHAEALDKLVNALQVPSERTHLHAGNPIDLLPNVSNKIGADLVVMGAVARSRLENAIVGSTAENVLDRLGCDVLVVKPKGFISPVTFKSVPQGCVLAH